MLRNKSDSIKAKLTAIIESLCLATHHSKSIEQRKQLCIATLEKTSLEMLTDEERKDNDLVRGITALESIIQSNLDNASISSLAQNALKTIMPLWAYEHGSDHFEQVPDRLLIEVSKLHDTSWHNNALPSFEFGSFETDKGKYEISSWIGFDNESYDEERFVFSLFVSEEGAFIESLDSESFREEFGLPMASEFGARGQISEEDTDKICLFLQTYGSEALHEKLLNYLKENEFSVF